MPKPTPSQLARLVRATLNPAAGNRIPRIVDSSTAHVLVDPADHTALGKALAVADSEGAESLSLVVSGQGSVAARRALGFLGPIAVWTLAGAELSETEPEPPPPVTRPDLPLQLLGELHSAGLDVSTEHAIVRGEVLGLEVARIAGDPPAIQVGVGAFDQEASALVHQDTPTAERLNSVRNEVLGHRRRGAPPHPFNRLVRERWIRALAVSEPSRVGMDHLEPVPPLVERGGLKDSQPCAALGSCGKEQVLVVFSVGMDIDLTPTASELATLHRPDRVVLAVSSRDRHPLNVRLAERLRCDTTFVDPGDL